MLIRVDRQSRDLLLLSLCCTTPNFPLQDCFGLLCAFFSITELKISEEFSVEQTIHLLKTLSLPACFNSKPNNDDLLNQNNML